MKKMKTKIALTFLAVLLSLSGLSAVPINDADYLVITHPALESSVWTNRLTNILEGRGFSVGWIELQDGTSNAEIKNIIHDAYYNGTPLRFVLLVGNGKNKLPSTEDTPVHLRRGVPDSIVDSGNKNFVPYCYEIMKTYYYNDTAIPVDIPYVEELYSRGPVSIGRVPAVSSEEVRIWVDKLYAYYSGMGDYDTWRQKEMFALGDVDHPSNGCLGWRVRSMADSINKYIPDNITKVFLKKSEIDPDNFYQSEACWSAFEDSINNGVFLINIYATGASQTNLGLFYSHNSHFNFSNKDKYPLLLGESCDIGELMNPIEGYNNSVVKDLLFFPDGGIIAAIAPTVESSQWGCREYSKSLHQLLYSGDFYYYGDLLPETEIVYESFMPSWMFWHGKSHVLFGDPSMPAGCYMFKNSNVAEDTEWFGSIVIENDITVEPNVKLTIRPGTGIFFKPGASLTIEGEFVSEGTGEFPVVYSVASEDVENDYWDGIVINSDQEVNIQYTVVRNAGYGIKILKSPSNIRISDSEIENCLTAGVYCENTTGNLRISGNTIQDNKGFGIWLETSYPYIADNVIANNKWGGILANNGSSPRISQNTITNNGFDSNGSYDGIHAMLNSHPKLYGIEEGTMNSCGVNNRIENNSRAGVGATLSSFPNLGTYHESLPWMFGGFNRIYGNAYDIANWNQTPEMKNIIYAQCNYWGWDRNDPYHRSYLQSIVGNVKWGPVAPIDQPQPTSDPIEPVLRLEMSGSYTTAIDGYETIIENNPDDEIVVQALSGIVRCYEELVDETGLMNKLDELMANYPGTLVEKWAKDNKLPYMIKHQEYEQALQTTDELLIDFADTEREPVYLYEQGRIYEKMADGQLGKYAEQSIRKYEELLNKYSDSPISFLAAVKLGKEPPEQKWAAVQPVPTSYALHPNYPNPFNPETTIKFDLPEDGHVSLVIYDITGKEVIKLINSVEPAGYHQVIWDGRDRNGNPVSSGVYIYRLQTGTFTQTRKMLLVK